MRSRSSKVARHFDNRTAEWDAYYLNSADIAGYEVLRRRQLAGQILQRLLNQPRALVIEVGCGTGRVISEIIERHADWQGFGLDISENMIGTCRTTYHNPRLRFQQHDIESSPLPEQADAVLSLGVFCYLEDPFRAIEHIYTMLKSGGLFIFSANKPSLPGAATSIYRKLRFKQTMEDRLCKTTSLEDTFKALDNKFCIHETYDYSYLPYVPVLRRMMPLARLAEAEFGRRPSFLSLTTLFVTRKM